MSKVLPQIPQARSWRDIPQPVKPRTMSGGGRRRLLTAGLRFAGMMLVVGAVAWVSWQVTTMLSGNIRTLPRAVKAVPVKEVVLLTDGVLDRGWILQTLALPKNASLVALDLQKLRERVLESGQVQTATLTLSFPDTLAVTVSERSPVARIKADVGEAAPRELLVARDGVVFAGVDFDPAMVETLPWLNGFTLSRQGKKLAPIPGMSAVAELLARAKLDAEHLYRNWEVVSLERLDSDGEIEVRSREGTRIVFGVREDYFQQLARLDLILDTVARAQPGKPSGEINLAIGGEPPVAIMKPVTEEREHRSGATLLKPASAQPISPASPNPQIKFIREL